MTANGLVFSAPRPEETEFSRRIWKSAPRVRSGSRWALIVSDIVAVAFIDAYPCVPSPYGRLPETAPPFVEASPRSEAHPAEAGTRPSPRVGDVHLHRRAARFHGGPRAHGVRRNLHRAPSTVLATVAPRHPERHWRCPRVRCDTRIPHVSQGTVYGIPIGSDLRKGHGSQSFRGSGRRGKPVQCSGNLEYAAASRNASTESGSVTCVVAGRPGSCLYAVQAQAFVLTLSAL